MTDWVLVFDLDDTLYHFASGIFALVRKRICQWLERALQISPEEAVSLQYQYFLTYGTTLAGLLHDHPEVDRESYLTYVHDVPVEAYISPDPVLDAMLGRLAARKVIFTNATADWADRVTRALGVRHHFDTIVDIYQANFISKPFPYPYQVLLQTLQVPPDRCIMLDDQVRNLLTAAQMGMRTLLVSPQLADRPPAIEHGVPDIYAAEPWLQALLQDGRVRS